MHTESEHLHKPQNVLAQLREIRYELARKNSERQLRRAVPDYIESPQSSFLSIYEGCMSYDMTLAYNELMALDAFGYKPAEVFERVAQAEEDAPVLEVGEADERIIAKRFGDGLTLSWNSETEGFHYDNKPQKLRGLVAERYKQSPAHQALHNTAVLLHERSDATDTVTTEEFDPNEDILGTNAALYQLGFIYQLDENLAVPVRRQVSSNHVDTTVNLNLETGKMSFSFTSGPDRWYKEHANQRVTAESIPFIETKCAQELFTSLAEVGLTINPAYQQEMVRIGEAERFGGVYTQISRELAKWVDTDTRTRVRNLFTEYDSKMQQTIEDQEPGLSSYLIYSRMNDKSQEEIDAEELIVREKLLKIDTSTLSEPTRLIVQIAQQAVTRDADTAVMPELPVTQEYIQISASACFDVAAYYLQSIDFGKLGVVQEDGVEMFKKMHGGNTYLLLHPTILNGVELPKGTLMQKNLDNKWAMLRLTPFCFDSEEDQLATGSELAKSFEYQTKLLQRFGSTALLSAMRQQFQ